MAVAVFRPGPVSRFGSPAVAVFRPALIAGLGAVGLAPPRPVRRFRAPLVGVFGPAPVSWSGLMAVAVFRPVLVSLPGIVAVAVLATRAIVLADRAVPVARVTGVTGFWPRPVPRFRHPAVTVRSGPVRFVCLRPVPFVPPVPRAWPAPVVLGRPRPIVPTWPAPVVACRPVPGLGPIGPRPVPSGPTRPSHPGHPDKALLDKGCRGMGPPLAGDVSCRAAVPVRSRKALARSRKAPVRVPAGPGHPGPSPRHSRRNSPASRVSGPVRVRRLSRAVGTALVSGSAARVSGRTRGPPRPGRRAGTLVARVVTRTGCPLRAWDPGGDSRRRSRPRFRPFRVRPVGIRPYFAQRDPVGWGAPVAPGAAVTLRNAVTPRDARAFPLPLMVLVRPGTAPLLVAFPARVAGRGPVVFVFVLGLLARMPAPVVRGTAIYPVPITVGCGVTTFHRAPPGHSDSDAPAHCGIHPEKSLGRAEYPISAECRL